ncbi:MAG: hypothetical protein Q9221_006729 [Calogaya cf. arnoldii]
MSTSVNTNRRSTLGIPGKFMGLTGKVVTVLVGPAETPFCIHWGLLTSKSSFFNAALTASWQESSEGKVRLAEEDPELFSIYVLWFYNQDWTSDHDGKALSGYAHCRLYILADKYGSEALQNQIIDILCERAAQPSFRMRLASFKVVYDNTLPGTPLRRLLADFLAWKLKLRHYEDLAELVPQCFHDALEVCKTRLSTTSGKMIPFHASVACKNYHVHLDETFCPFLKTTDAIATDANQSQIEKIEGPEKNKLRRHPLGTVGVDITGLSHLSTRSTSLISQHQEVLSLEPPRIVQRLNSKAL